MNNELVLFNSINTPYDFHRRACSIPVLTELEEKELISNCQQFAETSHIYQTSCQNLILHHLRVVSKLALKFANDIYEFKEIISEGIYGLIDAIKHFDLKKNTRFVTYAVWWVKYRVGEWFKSKKVVRNANNFISIEAPAYTDNDDSISLEEIIPDPNNNIELLEEEDSRSKRIQFLKDALQSLPERSQEIVIRYNNGETLQSISETMNISRERVRQIYQRSLEKLKEYFSTNNILINEI